MALLNKKILFVHINKSFGGIITDNFKQNGLNELTGFHRTLEDMLILSKTQYNINKEDLFIFTIVRNPWERMLSCIYSIIKIILIVLNFFLEMIL